MSPGLLVDGDLMLAGPQGTVHLIGRGTHLVLDATGIGWSPLVRMGFRARERRRLSFLTRAFETHRLRVDVERGGRALFSLGFGCRGGFLSRLLGGAAVAWRASA
ncbi:MAG: hypothetical protein PT977_10795 [Acidobacteriota bacterium]|nr:hypothetical protein [Acidobacteriota bacterium]